MEYWFAVAGRRFGPYQPAEFDAMLRSRQVPVDAWVYPPGAGRWLPVAEAVALYPPVPPAAWAPSSSPMAPPVSAGYPALTPINGIAITCFVLALVSIPLSFVLIGFALAVAAVVLGHLSIREIRRAQERSEPQRGRGLAIAGLVIGYGMIAFCALLIVAVLIPTTSPTPVSTDAEVQTDLRNAASAMELTYTETQEYTESIGVLRANGLSQGSDADLDITASETGYCISAFRPNATTYHFDSRTGMGTGPCGEQLLG